MAKPFERVMVLDFETYWDSKTYTLSKMTTEEYVRDPRFKAHGMAYKWLGEERSIWIPAHALQRFVSSVDWSTTATIAHNSMFDNAILAWHYGAVPAFIFDTLSMARATRGLEAGNSLAKLAEEFALPPKGKAVHSTDGLQYLTSPVEHELAEYCKHDVFLCEQIFENLSKGFPKSELRLIDMTQRMFVNPVAELDTELLETHLDEDNVKREALLDRLGVAIESLSSDAKFAEMLAALGEAPPRKTSKTTGKEAWAFAKNDALFQQLLASDNENVALLCEARLMAKSTQVRTRAQRLIDISKRGKLPVPLSYYGAHTGRWAASKGQAINLQNLKRGSFLRKAIMAPEGYVFVVADLSQIEPRVLAWLAGYEELLNIFRSGQDAYSLFGRQMFGIPDLTKDTHPVLRQSAKSALLGCGYGLGWASFAAQLLTGFLGAPPVRYDKKFLKQMGAGPEQIEAFLADEERTARALAIPRTCTDAEIILHCVATKEIVDRYRKAAAPVKRYWRFLSERIEDSLYVGNEYEAKGLTFRKGEIVLPNGMALRYSDLHSKVEDDGDREWVYGNRRKKLYGGSACENIVQAVARIVMTDGMLRIQKRYPVVLTVHDEVVALVPEGEAEEAETWLLAQMVKEPAYLPGIPLNAETGYARRYGEAKS